MDSTLTRSARTRDDRGFTLIESLTAATILLVIAVGVITVLVTTGSWYAKAAVRTQANTVAAQVLAEIRSRNYDSLEVVEGGVWADGAIPPTMTVDTAGTGAFSVETSITSVVDTITAAPMKLITVTVNSLRQPMETAAVAIAYVSGWESVDGDSPQFYVPVTVQCVDNTEQKDVSGDVKLALGGIRVELRDINDLSRVRYYAVTDSTGLATFPSVAEAEYWLTSDPTNPNEHAKFFPRRVYPAHGGSAVNPVPAVNHYNLAVLECPGKAALRVGAFYDRGLPSASTQPVVGLRIYAQAILNPDAGSSGYFGTGTTQNEDGTTTEKTRYPLPSSDPQQLTYSALTNAYGVAVIEVPWTLETGQRWRVWYSDSEYKLTDYPGSWNTTNRGVNEPERPPGNSMGDILQFQYIVGAP